MNNNKSQYINKFKRDKLDLHLSTWINLEYTIELISIKGHIQCKRISVYFENIKTLHIFYEDVNTGEIEKLCV